jgi:pSer/pThr/pTyr-binding forkhead associated (FHA) protein
VSATHHRSTPEELRQRLAAERLGLPFVLYLTADGTQQLLTLRAEQGPITIGRGEHCDVRLELDPEISRLHAELQPLGDEWLLADDGLSRNGTFVNGERIAGRHKLRDGDVVRCGSGAITFHDPLRPGGETTLAGAGIGEIRISDMQRRVLVALCRPLRDGAAYALPATNKEIADELFLSVQAVKAHLRTLFDKLGVEDLPHNQKRLQLVERALETGLIGARELH